MPKGESMFPATGSPVGRTTMPGHGGTVIPWLGLALSVLGGPGMPGAASLYGFSCGPAAENGTKAALMPPLTKQALGQGSEALPVSFSFPRQHSAPPLPPGTGIM